MISFVSVFPPYRGGISNFSDYLYRHLKERTAVNPYNFKVLYPDLLFPGATQFMDSKADHYAERVLHSYNPFNWRKTGNNLAVEKPEVLLFSFWHPFFIPSYNRIIKQVKYQSPETKVCTIAHNVTPHEGFPFSESLMRSFFERNDLMIVLSEQTRQEFLKLNISTPVAKIFHPVYTRNIPRQSKNELREKYNFGPDDRIPLFFGLIRDYKGLDIQIKALNKLDLKSLNIRPLIVGEFYSDKTDYLNLIREEHKDQYVIIDRFVTQEEANEVFSISDVLILPYKTASQSGVFNDALNFHLPAIVADHPGLTEYISHNKTGFIFESEDVEMLSTLIKDVFSQEKQLANISANLPSLKQQLSWDNFTRKLLDELEIKAQIHLP